MDYQRIKQLASRNDKAANEMLVALTAGAFAGTEDSSGRGAADRAAEALERILAITEGDEALERILAITEGDED